MNEKKLRRTSNDKMIGGVCGGLAEYFGLDSTLVRVAYVLLSICTAFSGVLVYLIFLLIMPED
ncbi:MAG: PspC domain-containing protein [Muribaculaceae bacterium]|jgi:phage shock protein PspC (stress-responsive transcriptional regulator)|nr:PspC domain-containing protein [Muribaculaceae bacterium]